MTAPTAVILEGHVLDVLRGLPSDSVHCIVSSPPYWGLRAYGTDPQVWGGNGSCQEKRTCPRCKGFGYAEYSTEQMDGIPCPLCYEGGTRGSGLVTHDWGEELPGKRSRWGNLDTLSDKQASNRGSASMVEALEAPGGAFCRRCDAWRGELGLEPTPQLFTAHLVEVFREARRVLRHDGTAWVNMGDCYAGTPNGWSAEKYRSRGIAGEQADDRTFRDKPFATTGNGLKPKDLCLMPARLAIALQEDGWWVRSDIIWHKPNPLPESILDRPTKSHEYVFLLAKSEEYFYDHEAVKEPAGGNRGAFPAGWAVGDVSHAPIDHCQPRPSKRAVGPTRKYGSRNSTDGRSKPHGGGRGEDAAERVLFVTRSRRTVWSICTQSYRDAHFACVDEETEALTPEGWKQHADLVDGDLIAAYDPARHTLSWQPATFSRFPYDGLMVAIEKRDSSQRLTPNHRCLVKFRSGNTTVVRADELRPAMQVPMAAPFIHSESVGIGVDWAALAGWFIAEGYAHPRHRQVFIYQSESANQKHVEELHRLLVAVGADYRAVRRERIWRGRPSVNIDFVISGVVAQRLREIAPEKKMTPQLADLPFEEASALIDALIDGDGHRRADGRQCIIQKDQQSVELMQLLAIRLGFRAHLRPRREGGFALYLTKGDWLTLRGTDGTHVPIPHEHYVGTVWCPSVETGFWLARRDGKPFITGNTFPEKLVEPCIRAGTSAHGVCGFCGAPWERITQKGEPDREWQQACGGDAEGQYHGKTVKPLPGWHNGQGGHLGLNGVTPKAVQDPSAVKARILEGMRPAITIGWRPTCDCHPMFAGEPVRPVVLDLFSGSATTGVVALREDRDYLGIELQRDYIGLSRKRLMAETDDPWVPWTPKVEAELAPPGGVK